MESNLAYFDIYSKRISFFFNNKEKIGTYFGLFLTLLYVLFSLILFITYLLIITKRKSAQIYDSIEYSNDIPNMEINPKLFYFAFGLNNPYTYNDRFIDESIYYPKILFLDKNTINGEYLESKELEYEICQEKYFGEEFKHLFTDDRLNNSYCLKDFNLTLIGGYKYDRISNIRIKLYPCRNNSENNNKCKPQEVIDSYLNNGYFSILMKDIGLNPNNYSEPIIHTFQNLYTKLNQKFIVYYRITKIKTDIGLFTENIEEKKYIQFVNKEDSFYLRKNESEIISIDFELDEITHIQKRVYTKISNILSLVGGYMQLMNTIFSLLSIISSKLIPELEILNGIFNFNLKQKKMTLRIHSIRDFNTKVFKKSLYSPLDKTFFNSNNNLNKNSLIDNNDNKNVNMSRNSLIQIDKIDNNSSQNILNNQKRNSLVIIREKPNENSKDSSNSKNRKLSFFNNNNNNFQFSNDKINNTNISNNNNINNHDNNNNNHKNYIYRVGSFYPKLMATEKKPSNNNVNEYTDQLNFNIFEYYFCRKLSKKRNHIELYKSGLSLYKKRMDIVNVFSLLLFSEKNCLQTYEFF